METLLEILKECIAFMTVRFGIWFLSCIMANLSVSGGFIGITT